MAQTWSISAVADVGSPAATSARKEPKELFATSLRLRSTLSSVHCAPLDDVATKAFVPCCSSKSDPSPSTVFIVFFSNVVSNVTVVFCGGVLGVLGRMALGLGSKDDKIKSPSSPKQGLPYPGGETKGPRP